MSKQYLTTYNFVNTKGEIVKQFTNVNLAMEYCSMLKRLNYMTDSTNQKNNLVEINNTINIVVKKRGN